MDPVQVLWLIGFGVVVMLLMCAVLAWIGEDE